MAETSKGGWVRRAAASPLAQRRAFLREPRAAIREAIGDEAELVLDALVIETPEWGERVRGLAALRARVADVVAFSALSGEGEADVWTRLVRLASVTSRGTTPQRPGT